MNSPLENRPKMGIGAVLPRVGGIDRVTGRQQFVADIHLPDELHVKLVTIDVAHARIISIDTTAALQVPEVLRVVTAADLPHPMPRFGPYAKDRPILATGFVQYHGEPLAAVVAESRLAAEHAAELVVVGHEPMAAVVTVEAALAPNAPLVQDRSLRPNDPLAGTNVRREHTFGWGDVDGAEADADLVIDGTYNYPMVTHFAIEPHGQMAAPRGDGLDIWSSIQHPFLLQKTIAELFDLPLAKVRVFAPDPGGGFGGKQNPKLEPLVAFLALTMQRPVRLMLTLDETFSHVRRTSARIRLRTGFRNDGTIVFQDFDNDFLAGAYLDISDRVVAKASYLSGGPYLTPDMRIRARTILSHTTSSTAFRGFGIPQVSWAREGNIDEAARRLGIDPIQMRLRNLPRYGEEFVPGNTPADGHWEQSVVKAAELIGWDTPVPPGRGRGIALGLKSGPTTGLSYSTVRLLADGSLLVLAGTSDMGQGARTVFAQIAQEEFRVPMDRIEVVSGDTFAVPFDQQTSASRSTVLMGTAVYRACQDVKAKVKTLAARHFAVPESDIEIDGDIMQLPDRKMTVIEAMQSALAPLGGEVIGNGEVRKDAVPGHPLGGTSAFFEFNITAVEVEVDRDTGFVRVCRLVLVGDAGRLISPNQGHGQDEGASVMGLGHTFMEQMLFDPSGRILNRGAMDYRIPTSMDLPDETIGHFIENGDGPGPYGVKGISEGGLLSVSPAIAAAVRDAAGVTIRDLPLTPERVWRALHEQDNSTPTGPERSDNGREAARE